MARFESRARMAMLSVLLIAAATGCSKSEPDASASSATAPAAETSSAEGAASAGPAQGNGFDLSAVPVSTAALGDFPYLQVPAGYAIREREGSDLDRVAFWTGDRLEWVEGRVFGAGVIADEQAGKTFSLLEFQRGIQSAVVAAGGRSIAQGRIPGPLREEIKQKDPELNVRFNAGMGDIWNQAVETYVIRREDRAIWVQVTGYEYGGNLFIAETVPVPAAAGG